MKNTENTKVNVLYMDASGYSIVNTPYAYVCLKEGKIVSKDLIEVTLVDFINALRAYKRVDEGIKNCLEAAKEHYDEWLSNEITAGVEKEFKERFVVLFMIDAKRYGGKCDTYYYYDAKYECYGYGSEEELMECYKNGEKHMVKEATNVGDQLAGILANVYNIEKKAITTLDEFVADITKKRDTMEMVKETTGYHMQFKIALECLKLLQRKQANA